MFTRKVTFEDAVAEHHVEQDSAASKLGWCAHLCGYQWTGVLLGDVVPMCVSTWWSSSGVLALHTCAGVWAPQKTLLQEGFYSPNLKTSTLQAMHPFYPWKLITPSFYRLQELVVCLLDLRWIEAACAAQHARGMTEPQNKGKSMPVLSSATYQTMTGVPTHVLSSQNAQWIHWNHLRFLKRLNM